MRESENQSLPNYIETERFDKSNVMVLIDDHSGPEKDDLVNSIWSKNLREMVRSKKFDILTVDGLSPTSMPTNISYFTPVEMPNDYSNNSNFKILAADIAMHEVQVWPSPDIARVYSDLYEQVIDKYPEFKVAVQHDKNRSFKMQYHILKNSVKDYTKDTLSATAVMLTFGYLNKLAKPANFSERLKSSNPTESKYSRRKFLKLAGLTTASMAATQAAKGAGYFITSEIAKVSKDPETNSTLSEVLNILAPVMNSNDFLGLRNAKIGLATIDAIKKSDSVDGHISAGIVLGDAHPLSEYPANLSLFYSESLVDTETRLLNYLENKISDLISEMKSNNPDLQTELAAYVLKSVFADYGVYEIPQTGENKSKVDYTLDEDTTESISQLIDKCISSFN